MNSLIANARAFLKMTTFILGISAYFLTAIPFYPYFKFRPMKARKIICGILGAYARFACWFMGIRVKKTGVPDYSDVNHLIVSNHLSYTDILVICAYYPACFVTSVEIRDTPFLGHICKLGGCVFVERRNKRNLSKEIQEVTDALKVGLDVVIFPEATSTNGEEVIRFRRPLFRAAIDSKVPIKPITINYRYLDGVEVSLKNRDSIFWYGDMTFADHLWTFLKMKRVDVDLVIGEKLKIGEEMDHGILAEKSHELVSNNYRGVLA